MAEINFKPQLCPNKEINLEEIKYPYFASYKLDGIRCVIHPDLGIVSRSLKPIPNKQINEMLEPVLQKCKEWGLILDGELYSHKLTFQEITSHVMTQDKEPPSHLKYYTFDILHRVPIDELKPFNMRYQELRFMSEKFGSDVLVCKQVLRKNAQEVRDLFKIGLDMGYEGLILRHPDSKYKYGRSTLKEATCFKVKPYIEKSAIIKGVIQATAVKEGTDRTINELGRSVTSKKKGDRITINKASALLVEENGLDLKVVIAATDPEKEEIWQNKDKYIGCELLYKGMDVGAKDLTRHPVSVRWWLKDE